jgi:hypothetical protein
MARARIIQKARQRYVMVPVIDPETGKQKEVPVTDLDGRPKLTRRGSRPIMRKLTVADKSQPLPLRKCEQCSKDLELGKPFRVISIRRQIGGYSRYRCTECPTWQPHEITSALWARIMQLQTEQGVDGSGWEDESEAEDAAEQVAAAIEELRDDKQESLDNMPEGLRDASELNEQVDQLTDWAETVRSSYSDASWTFPEGICENCQGEQLECSVHEDHSDDPDAENYCDGTEECLECNGSNEGEYRDEEEMEAWRQEAADAINEALNNSPL